MAFGIDFASTILGTINNSRLVIAIISKNALNSQWAIKELVIASKSNKKILVVLSENVTVQDIPGSIQYSSIAYLSILQSRPEELLDILQKLDIENATHRNIVVQLNNAIVREHSPFDVVLMPMTSGNRTPRPRNGKIVFLVITVIAIVIIVGLLTIPYGTLPTESDSSIRAIPDSTEISVDKMNRLLMVLYQLK